MCDATNKSRPLNRYYNTHRNCLRRPHENTPARVFVSRAVDSSVQKAGVSDANSFFGEHFKLAIFVGAKKVSECVLACGRCLIEISVELAPHGSIQSACAFQSLDASQLQSRSSEAKLHSFMATLLVHARFLRQCVTTGYGATARS
jgi:hypothetical protein